MSATDTAPRSRRRARQGYTRSPGALPAAGGQSVRAIPQAAQSPPATQVSAVRRWASTALGGQFGEVLVWTVLATCCAGATALLVASGVHYAAGPRSFTAGTLPLVWPPRLTWASLAAAALAAGVLGGVAWAHHRRAGRPAPPFWLLAALSYLGTVAWWLMVGLASRGGLRAAPSLLAAAEAGPGAALRSATGDPPGPALTAWALAKAGLGGALPTGVALTVLGALVVPLVAVAVRSLCHAPAARRLLPVLVLAPWAPFAAGSADGVTAALAAAAVAVGVVGCERGRRAWWALGAGLLLGVAALFAYAAIWLGVAIAAAYFVRRRPLLNVISGVAALVPLFATRLVGYSWPEGLSRADGDLFDHAALTWLVPNILAVLLCVGPVAVRAARRLTMTPGWPFLVGAGAAALFALLDGLAAGGVQSSWLPLFGWLAVPALAPRPRPAGPGDTSSAGVLPYGLVGVGAATAVALAALLAPR